MENTITTNDIMAQLEATAKAKKVERQVAVLKTQTGANRYLNKKDNKILSAIIQKITTVTEKQVFTGFTYSKNVEAIIAVANALQYMKGDHREQIPETIWEIFDADTRSDILEAYGRLPYLAEDLTIDIDGKQVSIDPDAKERSRAGIKPNVSQLEELVNTVALDLDLLGEYTCSQGRADKAWADSLRRVAKAELLDSYKESL